MINLSQSLAINPFLKTLSLTYCSIDAAAAQAIFEILIFTRSALEEINLSGNFLRNEGVKRVLLGASIAKSLKRLLMADNQFNDDEPMVRAMECCMVKNKTLSKYDFKYNNISDKGKFYLSFVTTFAALDRLTQILTTDATHVTGIEVPPRIVNKDIFNNFSDALAANLKAGKKGKKKGKKKK